LTSQQGAEHLVRAPVEVGKHKMRQMKGKWGGGQEKYEERRFAES
jgi:hypothetical protein